jgi:hypothetical protein
MEDRAAHLAWAKPRALEYVDRGEWSNAIASMISDLSKHRELQRHPGILLVMACSDAETTRHWIEEFN